jgi:O-antigen/teichoic acid export membrane protein
MSISHSLLRNTFFSIVSNLLNRLGNTLLLIFILQTLSIDAGGIYDLGISFFFIGSRFAFWGLDHLITREVAKDRTRIDQFASNFLFARIVLALIVIGLTTLIVSVAPYSAETRTVILLMVAGILPENITNLCWGIFAAFEEFYQTTFGILGSIAAKFLGGLLLVTSGFGVAGVAGAILVGHVLAAIVNLWLVNRRYVTRWQRPQRAFLQQQLTVAVPFIFIGMFYILDNRFDKVLLSLLSNTEAVGVYAAATAVIVALNMVAEGYRIAVLPIMTRYRQQNPARVSELYQRSIRILLALALPLTVGTLLLTDELIRFIYRQPLPEAVPALRIMVLALAFMFVNVVQNRLLIVYDKQAVTARFLLITTLLNLTVNALLIPRLDATGAAIGRAVSVGVLFILNSSAVAPLLPSNAMWPLLLRLGVANGIMAGVVWISAPLGFWPQVGIGALSYGIAVFMLGVISADDIRLISLRDNSHIKRN